VIDKIKPAQPLRTPPKVADVVCVEGESRVELGAAQTSGLSRFHADEKDMNIVEYINNLQNLNARKIKKLHGEPW